MSAGDTPEVRCAGCGLAPRPDEPAGADKIPWTWSTGTDEGRQSALCVSCTREHARSIEAKLDAEWW
jgi:hypothetical protein